MAKFKSLETNIHSMFGSVDWVATGVKTYPENFKGKPNGEFIRFSVVFSGDGLGISSGLLLVDIFTVANTSISRALEIADVLESFFSKKTVGLSSESTQFFFGSFTTVGVDSADPGLFRSKYSLPFSHTGAL
jgi:hypothetical protein